MAERLAFLLGKDPATSHGGDMTMFRTMHSIASERFATEVICLSDRADIDEPDIARLRKPSVSLPQLAIRSVARRRSLVHTRFDVDALRNAVEGSSADRFVAVHSYMAESYLRAERANPGTDLLVSTEVPESSVWQRTRGWAGRIEARRLRRDELRVAAAARAVGGYDRDEMDAYRADGMDAHWLPMTLAPVSPVDVAGASPRLALLGNRTWPPNARRPSRCSGSGRASPRASLVPSSGSSARRDPGRPRSRRGSAISGRSMTWTSCSGSAAPLSRH